MRGVWRMSDGDKIVGHKTFRDGRGFRHEPLRESEANALLARIAERDAKRAADMPTEKSAIDALFEAWLRLKEFGWAEAIYCPKDGSEFHIIEAGSTGIHTAYYHGEWPKGGWWVIDADDTYPSRPILYRKILK